MKKVINVGLVGFGLGGRVFHSPIINSVSNLHLHSIVIRDLAKIEKARKLYPWVEIDRDIETLLQKEEIDLVVVTVPNIFHREMVEKALLAGKHVVVDKPFTITTEEADSLIQLAKEKGKLLSVYQNRRFDSDFLTVQEIVKNRLLGNLVEYEAHFDRFRNYFKENTWKEENIPGCGILYDLGSHLIDQALVLFGSPKEITGDIRIQRQGGIIPDYFEVVLGYDNLKVTLQAGMLVRELGPHFTLKGDRGSFIKYGMDIQEEMLKAGKAPTDLEDWGREPQDRWGILNTDIQGLHFRGTVESKIGDYRKYYENIANAILGKEELYVKPQEARNVIALIELAMKSSEEKRTILLKEKTLF